MSSEILQLSFLCDQKYVPWQESKMNSVEKKCSAPLPKSYDSDLSLFIDLYIYDNFYVMTIFIRVIQNISEITFELHF